MSRQINFQRVRCFESPRQDVVQSHLSVARVLSDLREMLKPGAHQIAEAVQLEIDTIWRQEAQLFELGILDKGSKR